MRGLRNVSQTTLQRSNMKIFLSTLILVFVANVSLSIFYTKKFEKYREETNKINSSFEDQNRFLLDENDRLYAVLNKQEQQISILEESISPADKRWAKVKKVRQAIVDLIKEDRMKNHLDIIGLTNLSGAIVDYSEQYDVPISLILAITSQESAFNPRALSRAGAQGLMQLMPTTARECASDVNKNFYTITKIQDNIQLGTWYLSKMTSIFNGDVELAIRAYNCGPVYVKKVLAGEVENFPKETINYHQRVMKYRERFQSLGL